MTCVERFHGDWQCAVPRVVPWLDPGTAMTRGQNSSPWCVSGHRTTALPRCVSGHRAPNLPTGQSGEPGILRHAHVGNVNDGEHASRIGRFVWVASNFFTTEAQRRRADRANIISAVTLFSAHLRLCGENLVGASHHGRSREARAPASRTRTADWAAATVHPIAQALPKYNHATAKGRRCEP